MVMRHFCTYFNSGYLDRALVLRSNPCADTWTPFTLEVLCFDEAAYDFLTGILSRRFAANACRLLKSGNRISRRSNPLDHAPSIFSPALPPGLTMCERHKDMDVLTYLDADLCFFGSPESVFEAFTDKDVLITEHEFASDDFANLQYRTLQCGVAFVPGTTASVRAVCGVGATSVWRGVLTALRTENLLTKSTWTNGPSVMVIA